MAEISHFVPWCNFLVTSLVQGVKSRKIALPKCEAMSQLFVIVVKFSTDFVYISRMANDRSFCAYYLLKLSFLNGLKVSVVPCLMLNILKRCREVNLHHSFLSFDVNSQSINRIFDGTRKTMIFPLFFFWMWKERWIFPLKGTTI